MKNKKTNLYATTAFLYDFDNRDLLADDVKLCLDIVKETKGNILEIACGTGRVTIPILENITNRKITAFDLSEEMLSVFKTKISNVQNLTLLKEDMRNFDFNEKFGLIILIWRAFQVLLQEEDAKKCLQNIKRHMTAESSFLFSIFIPQESYGENWLGKENFSYESVDLSNNRIIKRTTKNLSSDEEKQIIEFASIFKITDKDGKCEVFEDKFIYKYYYPKQIKQLLKDNGFTIVKEYFTPTDMFFTLKI